VRVCSFAVCFVGALLPTAAESPLHTVRLTGTIQATRSVTVQVPSLQGPGGRLTLIRLIENGVKVHRGDVLAQFDQMNELKTLQDSRAKFDDLEHQVEQKVAENASKAEKRAWDLQQAQAELRKAQLEMRKDPILSEIEKEKTNIKLVAALEQVASLQRSNHFHELAESADTRILQLQRDRQKAAVERLQRNVEKLTLRASIPGMIALADVVRNNSIGHAREGDQLWPGIPLLRLFDPARMQVEVSVGEADVSVLAQRIKAVVRLDAFPELAFTAHFDSASPVAIAPLGSLVKTFRARFLLDRSDPHLLPDLSAALDIESSK
jgi:HlyD family secretion protein